MGVPNHRGVRGIQALGPRQDGNPVGDERDVGARLSNDEIFDRLYARFFGFVVKRLERRFPAPVAVELAQEVFIKVFKGLKDFRRDCSILSWITRITDTTAYNEYRSRHTNRRRGSEVSMDEPDARGLSLSDTLASDDDPQARAEHAEAVECVERALKDLPERERQAALQYFVHGLKYEEVARVQRVKTNTIKSQIHAARKKIQERCADHLLDRKGDEEEGAS